MARAGWPCTASTARIALELAKEDPAYEDIASKFWEHFLYIADAMNNSARRRGLVERRGRVLLRRSPLPNGESSPLKIRSMVGLIPLFAVETLEPKLVAKLSGFQAPTGVVRGNAARPYHANVACMRPTRALDEPHLLDCWAEQLMTPGAQVSCSTRTNSCHPYGIRALSHAHKGHPYVLPLSTAGEYRVAMSHANRPPASSAELELARPHLVPRELPPDRVTAEVPSLPGRRF